MGNLSYPNREFFSSYNQRKTKIITFSMMTQIFSKYQQNNLISLQSFNECLKFLISDESFPIISYTHLSEKLFKLLDTKKTGLINCEQFTKGMCMALSCQEKRIEILFEAMKINLNKNYLTFDEIYQFYYKTWISGLNYIFGFINYYLKQEFIEKKIPIPSNRDELLSIIDRHKEELKTYLIKSLYDSGINSNEPIYFNQFINWIIKDNTVEINYANKLFKFATSILYFENVGLNIQS